jgi:hypothetical protein
MSSTGWLSAITVPNQGSRYTLIAFGMFHLEVESPAGRAVVEMLSSAAQGVLTVQELADYPAHQPNYGLPPVVASLLPSTPYCTSSLASIRITLQWPSNHAPASIASAGE